jgi:hypothetical protein
MLMTSLKPVPVETAYVRVPPATTAVEDPRSVWEKAAIAATVFVGLQIALLALFGL